MSASSAGLTRRPVGPPWIEEDGRKLVGTPKVVSYRCGRCGELIPNDPTVPLSGCKAHEVRVPWAPHDLEPAQ